MNVHVDVVTILILATVSPKSKTMAVWWIRGRLFWSIRNIWTRCHSCLGKKIVECASMYKLWRRRWLWIWRVLLRMWNIYYRFNNFKWHKEQLNGKWYSVCDHKHVSLIEHTKDGKYKLRNANGKTVIHEDFSDAIKLALEVFEKFKKFNKSFTK